MSLNWSKDFLASLPWAWKAPLLAVARRKVTVFVDAMLKFLYINACALLVWQIGWVWTLIKSKKSMQRVMEPVLFVQGLVNDETVWKLSDSETDTLDISRSPDLTHDGIQRALQVWCTAT